MTFASEARDKFGDAEVQIARLKEQVEALMKDRVGPAVSDFAGRAEAAAHTARGAVKEQAQMVSGRVKEQPLVAILIAAAAGWIIGRVMR